MVDDTFNITCMGTSLKFLRSTSLLFAPLEEVLMASFGKKIFSGFLPFFFFFLISVCLFVIYGISEIVCGGIQIGVVFAIVMNMFINIFCGIAVVNIGSGILCCVDSRSRIYTS